MTVTIIILLAIAYLLGSIPSAVWVGKKFHGIDVREHGSGNAGATNTFRVLGKRAGIPVLLMDVLKGFLAVQLVNVVVFFSDGMIFTPNAIMNMKLGFGICAVVGHVFPVFAGFRGGKGIATLLGVVIAAHAPAALCALLIFLIILIVTKYVSLGSMLAGIAFPFLIWIIESYNATNDGKPPISLMIFSSVVALLVVITHQKNIERLLKRNENKTYLFKKKSKIAGFNEEEEVDELSK